ncbi:succinate dehydrogenase, cytochrome b556 subunit [Leeia sp. TBRC 13508]|uniref:Succinate dehydrogenase cytochrome b556 subunit n=1 Tax=Leeia speluncae TaxID=2884804 RepID=A0ABS8D952_9NEIS|nr:succinate dehydrogenase, cytochrome b556 subunit [Leeia speluncae]MCB6184747.1 succinate dehydrogenase, cytochrome b556 subunit [Leeia speluncae]
MQKVRPKHLDIAKIKLPWPGKVSILHRISGVGLFLGLPFLMYLLHLSLTSGAAFEAAKSFFSNPLVKLVSLGFIWAFMHHACAGVRFLLLDMHIGLKKPTAQASAKLVMVISIALTLVIGGVVLL